MRNISLLLIAVLMGDGSLQQLMTKAVAAAKRSKELAG